MNLLIGIGLERRRVICMEVRETDVGSLPKFIYSKQLNASYEGDKETRDIDILIY